MRRFSIFFVAVGFGMTFVGARALLTPAIGRHTNGTAFLAAGSVVLIIGLLGFWYLARTGRRLNRNRPPPSFPGQPPPSFYPDASDGGTDEIR